MRMRLGAAAGAARRDLGSIAAAAPSAAMLRPMNSRLLCMGCSVKGEMNLRAAYKLARRPRDAPSSPLSFATTLTRYANGRRRQREGESTPHAALAFHCELA